MTIVHRSNANKATNTTSVRTYASVVDTVPNLSIRVPEPVHTTNSYSVLDSNKSSDSEPDKDSSKEFTWKDATSQEDEKDDSDYDDMPPLMDDTDTTSDNVSDETSDETTYVSEQDEDFVSDKTSDEESSDDDIIVNHKQYQRVRTDKRCNDGIPHAIQLAFFFFALAQFMQLVFLVCKSVPHRHCISDPF
jgi:hypothetical protein